MSRPTTSRKAKTNELQPCPFCGETKNLVINRIADLRVVACHNCCCHGPLDYENEEGAIRLWNRSKVAEVVKQTLPEEVEEVDFLEGLI